MNTSAAVAQAITPSGLATSNNNLSTNPLPKFVPRITTSTLLVVKYFEMRHISGDASSAHCNLKSPNPLRLHPHSFKQRIRSILQHKLETQWLPVYKVLSTNFESAARQGALQYLSDIYSPLPLFIKGKKPARLHEDDDEIKNNATGNSLLHQSPVKLTTGKIGARAQKNLRGIMEKKLAEGSWQFLKALGEIDQIGTRQRLD